MDAIIFSGLPAVGKTTVARLVAQRLGLKVVGGGDILREIAAEAGVKTSGDDDWWDKPEGISFLQESTLPAIFKKEEAGSSCELPAFFKIGSLTALLVETSELYRAADGVNLGHFEDDGEDSACGISARLRNSWTATRSEGRPNVTVMTSHTTHRVVSAEIVQILNR